MGDALVPLLADGRVDAQGRPGYCLLPGLGPSVAGRLADLVGFPDFRSWHWWECVARLLGLGPQLLVPLASAPYPGLRQNLSGNCLKLQRPQPMPNGPNQPPMAPASKKMAPANHQGPQPTPNTSSQSPTAPANAQRPQPIPKGPSQHPPPPMAPANPQRLRPTPNDLSQSPMAPASQQYPQPINKGPSQSP